MLGEREQRGVREVFCVGRFNGGGHKGFLPFDGRCGGRHVGLAPLGLLRRLGV